MLVNIVQTFDESDRRWLAGMNPDVDPAIAQRWIADGKAVADPDATQNTPVLVRAPVEQNTRGDSFALGLNLSSASKAFGAIYARRFGLREVNYGVSATGVLRQFSDMVAGVSTPVQTGRRHTLWGGFYNDMRSGATAGRLDAARGVLETGLVLALSNWAGLRQFYNGGAGGTFYGAPASSYVLGGSWGISGYGLAGRWKGVQCATNGNTITALVNGPLVIVCYPRQVVNTGGTFSVAIDGVTVKSSVSMNGTGLGVETNNDKPTADSNTFGYPTLLMLPTSPGPHTVVLTVTSATAGANLVQNEFIAGIDDLLAGHSAVLLGCPRMNAAGYAGSNAAYASQAIGDAAVAKYQQIGMEICARLRAHGFDIAYASPALYDPTVAVNVQGDNIHPTDTGQDKLASAAAAVREGPTYPAAAPALGTTFDVAVPASGTAVQNLTPYKLRYAVAGGTVSAVAWSQDDVTYYTGSATTGALVDVPSGGYIKVTYSVAPTMTATPVL